MVAREEKLVAIEQHRMTAGVPGNRDREQIVVEPGRFFSADHVFNPKSRGAIVGMHHAFTVKFVGEARMIGDIVPMRQKHGPYTAHRGDLFYELSGESRRIDQHVAAIHVRPDEPGEFCILHSDFLLRSVIYFRLYASTPAARIFIARARSSQLST